MAAGWLPDGRIAVPLSAHDEELVPADARAILDYLQRTPSEPAQVAAHLAATRRLRRHRAVVRAGDCDELAAGLRAVAENREHPLVTRAGGRTAGRTAFVFPGQGSQWPAMGAESYRELPAYRAEADRLDAAFSAAGLASPLPFLVGDYEAPAAASHLELQAAQFVHSVALAAVWRACGMVPDVTIGHSLGEVAAAYVARAITLDDAVAVLAARAAAIAAVPGENGVAVLGVDTAEAAELIAATDGWLELSAVNAQTSVAVAGERTAVAAIVEAARARGRFARELAMSFPAHTTVMESQREELCLRLPASVFTDSPVQFVGSATGQVVAPGTDFGRYWYDNLRNTIRFDQAVRTAIGLGVGIYIELSAHPSLLFAIEDGVERAGATAAVLVGSGHRDTPVRDSLAANVVAAAAADPGHRWADLLTGEPARLYGFPGAPMRAEHLWAQPEPLPAVTGLTVTTESWRPRGVRPVSAGTPRRIAVVEIGDATTQAAALRAAVDAHPGASLTSAADADLVIAVAPAFAGTDPAGCVDALADALDTGLLGYADGLGPRCRDVWLVTVGAENVTADDPVADIGQAGLAAMHRCIGFEYADASFHHLDLPAGTVTDAAVVDVILTGAGELALRGDGTVYERILGEDAATAPPWKLDAEALDNVVITGGSGAIGLSYARFLAARGARRIVLLSRRGVAPAVLDGLGGEICAPACDLRDPGQVAEVAAAFAGGPASLLIHAAGTATFANRAETTGAAVVDMAAAKIVGLESLTRAWPIRDDARILLCSSVTGVWGGKGVGGYAAANRMLDVMAGRLRADGRNCTAVRFGLWEGSGIVDAAEIARVERTGLRQMKPELAVEASLCDFARDPLVLSADPDRMRVFFGEEPVQTQQHAGAEAVAASMTAPDAVRSQLAAVLGVDAGALDLDSSLFDLGVDSLLALDLRKRLKRLTGHTVALATLLGGITGTDLIAGLSEKVDSSSD
ncbi:mycobactin polyketide synthase MbtD [Mycobacterium sp. NAZ190054]|uniref:mycobactin polyketide synthase MbtD n=1 Tax=Mycobacterium sp. NAZ190054 TaxID=1747766 RepID=UPI0007930FAE|nr:mycobactin polyketide synthase MbtD [Mycobacterium sp. NAZ190054]KWX67626.1 polyketide synthase [Mycobacterium sp. NAZ190054]